MQVKIQNVSLRPYKRVLVTSDIHGHGHLLKELLQRAAFSKDDALIIVGDMIEKGPDSLGTLRYVMELAQQKNVFPMMGNVDLWRLTLLETTDEMQQREVIDFCRNAKAWWGSSILDEMAKEMGLDIFDEKTDLQGLFEAVRVHFAKELDFIRQLPTILEAERFTFVHGGLTHENMEEVDRQTPFALLKNDDFLGKGLSFSKWVVVGHWPVALYGKDILQHGPVFEKERHILSIDGGCGVRSDGQLNLLITDWEGKQFCHIAADEKEKIRAMDGQEASQTARNIPWHDPDVELIDRNEKWAKVSHHGYKMRIPIHFLQGEEGNWKCYNLTDYRLQVLPGDEISLIFEHDGIIYGKKDDVCGWYEGRYQMIKE